MADWPCRDSAAVVVAAHKAEMRVGRNWADLAGVAVHTLADRWAAGRLDLA